MGDDDLDLLHVVHYRGITDGRVYGVHLGLTVSRGPTAFKALRAIA